MNHLQDAIKEIAKTMGSDPWDIHNLNNDQKDALVEAAFQDGETVTLDWDDIASAYAKPSKNNFGIGLSDSHNLNEIKNAIYAHLESDISDAIDEFQMSPGWSTESDFSFGSDD